MPKGTEAAGEPVELAELYSKAEELAAKQESGIARILSSILPVLAWLDEPVVVRPGSLAGPFRAFRSVALEPGGVVVMTDAAGRVSSRKLSEFRTQERLAILNGSYAELQRMVAIKRRAGKKS